MPRTKKKVKSIVKTKVISARVTEVVHELLHQQAEDAGMTLSEFAAQMLTKGHVKQSFRQSSLSWCGGFWKPKLAGRTMPKRWPCLQAFSTVGTAAAGWYAGRPAIKESGTSIISAPAANRTKAVARAIICGMKNSITLCGMRSRCRSRS